MRLVSYLNMKQIILARHPETELIASGSGGQRRNDSLMSEFGRKQAEEVRDFIKSKNLNYQAVFTSLFHRAYEMGKIVNEKNVPFYPTDSFNEYFQRDDGKGVETTDMGAARTMTKIYSMFDIFDEIVIVAHASINKTILQNIVNNSFDECKEYYNLLGETHVLRLDWEIGDKTWSIVDSFTPTQPEKKESKK